MFRDLFRPQALALPLRPINGEIQAHVFENPRAGVRRNLFWNISVEFEPVHMGDERWDCSFAVEWLTWPMRTWPELNGAELGKVVLPEMVEASLYLMAEHHPAAVHELRLLGLQGATFEAAISASAQITTERGKRTVPMSFVCPLRFIGIIVVRDNLEPTPNTSAQAGDAVARFIQMDRLRQPRSEQWRYVFEPDA
jgi:hypothetical protein